MNRARPLRRFRGPEPGKPEAAITFNNRCLKCGFFRMDKRHRAHVALDREKA